MENYLYRQGRSEAEFLEIAVRLGITQPDFENCIKTVYLLDVDGDGEISEQEFIEVWNAVRGDDGEAFAMFNQLADEQRYRLTLLEILQNFKDNVVKKLIETIINKKEDVVKVRRKMLSCITDSKSNAKQVNTLNKRIEELALKNKELEEDAIDFTKSLTEALDNQTNLRGEFDRLRWENSQVKGKLSEALDNQTDLRGESDRLRREKSQVKDKLSEVRLHSSGLEETVAKLIRDNSVIQKKYDEARRNSKEFEKQRDHLKEELEALTIHQNESTNQICTLEARIGHLVEESTSHQLFIEELHKENQNLNTHVNSLLEEERINKRKKLERIKEKRTTEIIVKDLNNEKDRLTLKLEEALENLKSSEIEYNKRVEAENSLEKLLQEFDIMKDQNTHTIQHNIELNSDLVNLRGLNQCLEREKRDVQEQFDIQCNEAEILTKNNQTLEREKAALSEIISNNENQFMRRLKQLEKDYTSNESVKILTANYEEKITSRELQYIALVEEYRTSQDKLAQAEQTLLETQEKFKLVKEAEAKELNKSVDAISANQKPSLFKESHCINGIIDEQESDNDEVDTNKNIQKQLEITTVKNCEMTDQLQHLIKIHEEQLIKIDDSQSKYANIEDNLINLMVEHTILKAICDINFDKAQDIIFNGKEIKTQIENGTQTDGTEASKDFLEGHVDQNTTDDLSRQNKILQQEVQSLKLKVSRSSVLLKSKLSDLSNIVYSLDKCVEPTENAIEINLLEQGDLVLDSTSGRQVSNEQKSIHQSSETGDHLIEEFDCYNKYKLNCNFLESSLI